MEEYWLSDNKNKKFLITNQITLADLSAACELAQTRAIDLNLSEKYPKVNAWLERIM